MKINSIKWERNCFIRLRKKGDVAEKDKKINEEKSIERLGKKDDRIEKGGWENDKRSDW